MCADIIGQIPIINSRIYSNDSFPSLRESPNKYSRFHKFVNKKKLAFYHPPPPPLIKKKVLVLDLDETLIHSSLYIAHPSVKYFILEGDDIYIQKDDDINAFVDEQPKQIKRSKLYIHMRPGLEDFLSFAQENFEVFVYTYAERSYAEPILDYIFPDLDEDHRLYRDSCIEATKLSVFNYYSSATKANKKIGSLPNKKQFKVKKPKRSTRGIIKDLFMLGRNINDIIFVDDNDYHELKVNNNNTIVIPSWKGTPNDDSLTNWLIPILNNCIEASDVRYVINNHSKKSHRLTF